MAEQKMREESMPCFRSYEDARQFALALLNKLRARSEDFKNGNSNELDLEIYIIIWTMLTTPLGIEDLLPAKQGDLYLRSTVEANISLAAARPDMQPCCVHLSDKTAQAILDLHQRRNTNSNKLIFQRLNTLDKESRKVLFASKIDEIWARYEINPETFILFFQYVANRYSSFKPEFIGSFIKKQNGNPQWLLPRFLNERKTLTTWWEMRLLYGDFCF